MMNVLNYLLKPEGFYFLIKRNFKLKNNTYVINIFHNYEKNIGMY